MAAHLPAVEPGAEVSQRDENRQDLNARQIGTKIYAVGSKNSVATEPVVKEEFQQPVTISKTPSTSLADYSVGHESLRDILEDVKDEPFDEPLLCPVDRNTVSTNESVLMERAFSDPHDRLNPNAKDHAPKSLCAPSRRLSVYRREMQNLIFRSETSFQSEDSRRDMAARQMGSGMCYSDSSIVPLQPEVKEENQQSVSIVQTPPNSRPLSVDRESPRNLFNDVKDEPVDEPLLIAEERITNFTDHSNQVEDFSDSDDVRDREDKVYTHKATRSADSSIDYCMPKRNSRKVKYELFDRPLFNQDEDIIDLTNDSDEPEDDFSDFGEQEDPEDKDYIPKELSSKTKNVCKFCERHFHSSQKLTQHIRIHTGERPYICKLCKKTFARKDYLNIHMRRHSDEKPFQCYICDKEFRQKHGLIYHFRIHTGEKPFPCDLCSRAFRSKGALNIHVRTHPERMPFECKECFAKFPSMKKLSTHFNNRHV